MDDELQPGIDPVVERKLVRKIDFRLMPVVMLLNTLAVINRSNLGSANVARMSEKLELSDAQFKWVAINFYIAYILFEPLALMWKVVPPHKWGAFCVLGLGVCASLQATVQSWSGLMAARFFLGAFEAAFAPGITFLLSFFYLRNELSLRCGIYLSIGPLASSFTGALAYAITLLNENSNEKWRLIFLFEGVPLLLAAILTWFLLPDSPETAKFLNRSEQKLVALRVPLPTTITREKAVHGINWREIPEALSDYKLWIVSLMQFSCHVSYGSVKIFLPMLLKSWCNGTAEESELEAQKLSVAPYLCAFLAVLITTYIAARTSQSGITICLMSLVCATGYLILAIFSGHPHVRYAAVFLVTSGLFSAMANIAPWTINNQETTTKKGVGVALSNLIGQCGAILGIISYHEDNILNNAKGMWICFGFLLFNAFLAAVLRTALWVENRRMADKEKDWFKNFL